MYCEVVGFVGGRIEIDLHRVVGTHAVSRPPLAARPPAGAPAVPKGQRQVHFGGTGFVATQVFDGTALQPGHVIAGPAVIERMGDSVVLPPGHQAAVDPFLSLRLSRVAEQQDSAAAAPAATGLSR